MLYYLVYFLLVLASPLYFRRFTINKKRSEWNRKPVARLFAVNHSNSFVDPIVIAFNLPFPTWFLARGDALAGPIGRFVARSFYIMPVWRQREGAGNLKGNYDTFARCMEIWKTKGSVMIFAEGLCENDWRLKPLPKGTARLVWQAWEQGLELEIIPTGVNYEHFHGPGKQCEIRYGAPMAYADLLENTTEARFYKQFNERLFAHLQPLVVEAADEKAALVGFSEPQPRADLGNALRSIAKFLHAPLYLPLRSFFERKTAGTVHFDAALFGSLLLVYPLFILLLATIIGLLGGPWWLAALWPLFAYLGR